MLLSPHELLNELHALGLLSPEEAERASATGESDGDPVRCADQLVAAGVLTAYQAKRILAGRGRQLVVGPYVLLDRLGRGGMGHVYKARHRLMRRVVALKIVGRLRRGRGGSAARRRFRREVQAVGRLHHPGIVTAHDAGAARGRLYLAMEHVEGIDLHRLVRDTGPLSIDLAREVVRQTAEALRHAHERGVVHRDVKPSNLMLAAPGATVKLLDLGLAQFTDNSLSSSSERDRLPDENLCGTPDFMAPEYGHERRRSDVRPDLYSLGCTFYFLLTGQVPHPGGNGTEKLLRHSLDAPAPVRVLRPEVPVEVAAIVERLMARRAEDRYPTASAVAAELAALRCGGGEGETVVGEIRPKKNARRSRPSLVSLGALLAILLGVAAAAGARWIVKPLAASAAREREATEAAFQIEERSESFASLAEAVASANDGDVVIVHGSGPFVSPPLSWRGKSLTIRAGGKGRPSLVLKPQDDPWQALLHTDRRLVLEGLDLMLGESSAAPLIRCEGAPLRLTDCRLTGGADGPAVVVRDAQDVSVQSCRITAGAIGLSVEIGRGAACRVRVVDSSLRARETSGAALSLWAPDMSPSVPVSLELERNRMDADRMAAIRALPGALTLTAHDNHFTFRTALLSYTACARRDAWRGTVWQGGGNDCEGPAAWLWVDGKPVPSTEQTTAR